MAAVWFFWRCSVLCIRDTADAGGSPRHTSRGPVQSAGQAQQIVGADVIVLAEFDEVSNRRRIVACLVPGDLHLMVADGGGQLPLRFVVVNAYINHALDHEAAPPLLDSL